MGKRVTGITFESVEELRAYLPMVAPRRATPLFAPQYRVAVSNPPYTISYAGRTTLSAQTIYPLFFFLGYAVAAYSSVVSPARWFTSSRGEARKPREDLRDMGAHFLEVHHFEDRVFEDVYIQGGISWFLLPRRATRPGTTKFFKNNGLVRVGPSFDKDGLVSFSEVSEIREKIWKRHRQLIPTKRHFRNWNSLAPSFFKAEGMNNKAFFNNSTESRQADSDIKMRMTNGTWRYFKRDVLREYEHLPENKVGLAFSAFANDNSTVNDRTFVLLPKESAKSTMVIPFDTLQEVGFCYKYSRTRFFTALLYGRLSSHNAYPQAYQDVPMFAFDGTDPIDWTKSIPEIDEQLIAHFRLARHRKFLASMPKPYSRGLDADHLERLSDAGFDVAGINDWYH